MDSSDILNVHSTSIHFRYARLVSGSGIRSLLHVGHRSSWRFCHLFFFLYAGRSGSDLCSMMLTMRFGVMLNLHSLQQTMCMSSNSSALQCGHLIFLRFCHIMSLGNYYFYFDLSLFAVLIIKAPCNVLVVHKQCICYTLE